MLGGLVGQAGAQTPSQESGQAERERQAHWEAIQAETDRRIAQWQEEMNEWEAETDRILKAAGVDTSIPPQIWEVMSEENKVNNAHRAPWTSGSPPEEPIIVPGAET